MLPIFFGVLLLSGALLLLVARHSAEQHELLLQRISRYCVSQADAEVTLSAWRRAARGKEHEKLHTLLARAGWRQPDAVYVLLAVKLLVGLILAVLADVLIAQENMGMRGGQFVALLVVGGILPEMYLRLRAERLARQIVTSIADAADLIVICVESGMTIDKSLDRVGTELKTVAPELSRELLITENELRMLPDRNQVFSRLAWRVNLPEVEQLVFSIQQADKFGSSLASALRIFAADVRQMQILRTEERLGKIPAKMGVPLMTLVLLPLVIMIAGPALVNVLRALES